MWSAASGECLLTLNGHENDVESAVFSPDGKQVLTASYDGCAKVRLRTLSGRKGPVNSAVFSLCG